MGSPFRSLDFDQIQVQLQLGPITIDNFRSYLEEEGERLREAMSISANPLKAVVVVDGSVALMPPAEARKLQAEWLKEYGDVLARVTHKIGFVLPNPLLRNLVGTVMKMTPMPCPTTVHPDLEQALDWAITEADSIGGVIAHDLLMDGTMAVERRRAWCRP